MRKYTLAIKTLLLFVKYLVVKQPSTLSNDRLAPMLRMQVHNIEKGLVEEASDFFSVIWARKLYYEAKKRSLLSYEEEKWCKRILFGREVELTVKSNGRYNNAFMEIVRNRRSVRSWENGKLKDNEFEHLVNVARWAPSSCNRQPWYFILTRDANKIKLLSEIRGQKSIGNAPSCILVLINMQSYDKAEASYTPFLDAGAAIQNLLLMAQILGLGACWVNFGPNEVDETKREKVKTVFRIPAHYEVVSIIPIGHPKIIPLPPGRKDLSNILHVEIFKESRDDYNHS
ncbi:MAG TPA: nitroreductase family protein [Candidatus Bathyarchaeia archaeon]|nr:nitroreductase family protein [Candidatus Bathyarchaeia archaeon]